MGHHQDNSHTSIHHLSSWSDSKSCLLKVGTTWWITQVFRTIKVLGQWHRNAVISIWWTALSSQFSPSRRLRALKRNQPTLMMTLTTQTSSSRLTGQSTTHRMYNSSIARQPTTSSTCRRIKIRIWAISALNSSSSSRTEINKPSAIVSTSSLLNTTTGSNNDYFRILRLEASMMALKISIIWWDTMPSIQLSIEASIRGITCLDLFQLSLRPPLTTSQRLNTNSLAWWCLSSSSNSKQTTQPSISSNRITSSRICCVRESKATTMMRTSQLRRSSRLTQESILTKTPLGVESIQSMAHQLRTMSFHSRWICRFKEASSQSNISIRIGWSSQIDSSSSLHPKSGLRHSTPCMKSRWSPSKTTTSGKVWCLLWLSEIQRSSECPSWKYPKEPKSKF